MFEKVLVPLDGSELAETALYYAQNLAGTLGSEITLLHVCEERHTQYEHMHKMYIEEKVESTKSGAQLYPGISGGQPIKVKSVILHGNPAEQIVDYADREDISVINMATHGWSGITRWVTGSVADKVLQSTKRPVALFRAESARTYVSVEPAVVRYLVPLDGSKEGETILPYVEELATRIGGEAVLLHVLQLGSAASPTIYDVVTPHTQTEMEGRNTKAEAYMKKVCTELEDKGIKTRCETRFGTAAQEIIKLADETSADVIAMATHARSFFGRFAIGSTAEKVLHDGKSPLLLIKA